jgi:hypothetical protein
MTSKLLAVLSILLNSHGSTSQSSAPSPILPLQFIANLTVKSTVNPDNSEYPPGERRLKIYYDYLNERARADISEGYEASKTYIRQYGLNREYMVRHPPIRDCKRSYLGDLMPYPSLPNAKWQNTTVVINNHVCNYFIIEETKVTIHVYLNSENSSPVRLEVEHYNDSESVKMITYDYSEMYLQAPAESYFNLPNEFTHETCDDLKSGFPYLHIFHHFIRI